VKSHKFLRSLWWTSNFLLAASLVATIYSGVWEISLRRYLRGFSDAIIPEAASTQQKAEAILAWMLDGPPRFESTRPALLSARDPEDTLNLLEVCGSATNAFLNLSRSAGVPARRLLEATGSLPNYSAEYTYQRTAHVRLAALPFHVGGRRALLDRVAPQWEESLDWTLLLERRSFAAFFFSVTALVFFLVVRLVLGWIADNRLRVPRFHLRANLSRATAAFFTSPEIK
jgi:hypothetical protein